MNTAYADKEFAAMVYENDRADFQAQREIWFAKYREEALEILQGMQELRDDYYSQFEEDLPETHDWFDDFGIAPQELRR